MLNYIKNDLNDCSMAELKSPNAHMYVQIPRKWICNTPCSI